MTETKKDPNSPLRLVVILTAICAVTALLLGLVNYITADRISELKAEKTRAALSEVLAADDYTEIDYTGDSDNVTAVYKAGDAGYIVEAVVSGSQGDIDLVVGIGTDGTVTGVSIIDSSETSNLGSKASEPEWLAQFIGAGEAQAVDKDGGEIDALTGATVTSRAVTNGVNLALETVKEVQP